MNAQLPPNDDDKLQQEAAEWCLRLHGSDCTENDRHAFQRWIEADPKYAEEYLAMQDIWSLSEQLPHSEPLPPLCNHTSTARSAVSVYWRRRSAQRVAIALLCILPIVGYSGWVLGWLPNDYHRYQAQQRLLPVTLPDGSQLELNLETRLSFANYRDQRRIYFDAGEAFFQVQHDHDRPFIVSVGTSTISVTGTQFNVFRYQDNVMVTVTEGSVRVRTTLEEGDSSLTPGLQASYLLGDSAPNISSVDTSKALAWRKGKLILDNLSLAQALPLINRYLETPLELADSTAANLRIGGVYNTQEMAGIIDVLPQVLPIQINKAVEGRLLIMSRKG